MRRIIRVVLAGLLLAGGVGAQQKKQQEIDLQAAIRTETVGGDLKGAIRQYEAIVGKRSGDRAVSARALIHMAACYEKLGETQARTIYERVVREFADQNDAVTTARAHLGKSGGPLTARMIMSTTGSGVDLYEVSSDGRLGTGADWSNGDLFLRDMGTGEIRRLLTGSLAPRTLGAQAAVGRYVAWSVISPDKKQVVFSRYGETGNSDQGQLWVISTEPAAKPRLVTKNPEFRNIIAEAWSLDGKSVLARISRGNQGGQFIGWISVADGSVNALKSFPWKRWTNYRMRLSPDGKYIAYSAAPTEDSNEMRVYVLASDGSTETAVATTAGLNDEPIWTPDGAHILFTSDRAGSFDLWSIRVRDGKPVGEASLVKRDIGKIQNLGLTRTGCFYYASKNFVDYVSIAAIKPSAVVTESFVGLRPTLSPDGQRAALGRYHSTVNGTYDLVVRSLATGEEKVYSHEGIRPGHYWFPDGKAILATAFNKDFSRGWMYRVDVGTGEFKQITEYDAKILTGAGSAAISADQKTLYMVARESKSSDLNKIVAYDPATEKYSDVFKLQKSARFNGAPLRLSPDGRTLAIHVVDEGYSYVACLSIDGSGYRELYKDHKAAVAGIAWTADGHELLFGRRNPDDTWQVMSVPVTGGNPVPTGLRFDTAPLTIAGSADGMRLAISTRREAVEVWALDNVLTALK